MKQQLSSCEGQCMATGLFQHAAHCPVCWLSLSVWAHTPPAPASSSPSATLSPGQNVCPGPSHCQGWEWQETNRGSICLWGFHFDLTLSHITPSCSSGLLTLLIYSNFRTIIRCRGKSLPQTCHQVPQLGITG